MNNNKQAIRSILEHPFVGGIILIIGMFLLWWIGKKLIKSIMAAWKEAKDKGDNKWAAIGVELLLAGALVSAVAIFVSIPGTAYVDFFEKPLLWLWEGILFAWELTPWGKR